MIEQTAIEIEQSQPGTVANWNGYSGGPIMKGTPIINKLSYYKHDLINSITNWVSIVSYIDATSAKPIRKYGPHSVCINDLKKPTLFAAPRSINDLKKPTLAAPRSK